MTIQEVVEKLERIKKDWPGGFNFKNKSKFAGIAIGEFEITPEMLESKEWTVSFESYDEKFNEICKGLMTNMQEGIPDQDLGRPRRG